MKMLLLYCLCVPVLLSVLTAGESQNVLQDADVLYFAYGSNLLSRRIHVNINATRAGTGRLKNYRLDFDHYSMRWNGRVATIVPDNYTVWGAVWKISTADLKNLDIQEGTNSGVYLRFLAKILRPNGKVVHCYTYQLVNNPTTLIPLDKLPVTRQPSKLYHDTIVRGAHESGLPNYYQEMLIRIKDNGYEGEPRHDVQ